MKNNVNEKVLEELYKKNIGDENFRSSFSRLIKLAVRLATNVDYRTAIIESCDTRLASRDPAKIVEERELLNTTIDEQALKFVSAFLWHSSLAKSQQLGYLLGRIEKDTPTDEIIDIAESLLCAVGEIFDRK